MTELCTVRLFVYTIHNVAAIHLLRRIFATQYMDVRVGFSALRNAIFSRVFGIV